jgi:hypothetical protein
MRILFFTCRNIDKKGGENALIVGRHGAFFTEFGVETDIIFYHKDTSFYNNEFLVNGMNFIDCKKENAFEKIIELLQTKQYSDVVISGFYNNMVMKRLGAIKELYGFRVIIDIHGTIREVYECCSRDLFHLIGTRYIYLKKRAHLIYSLKKADCAFVVSDEAITETSSFSDGHKLKYMKTRCGSNTLIDTKMYLSTRKAMRIMLGISDKDVAYVYSGSKDRWQKFDATVELFEKISKSNCHTKFAFYMNMSNEDILTLKKRFGKDQVLVRWVSPDSLQNELLAFDVGIMLRDNITTNNVAFPNKFSDYVHAALGIVLPQYVCEPYRIASDYNLDLLTEFDLLDGLAMEKYKIKRENSLIEYVDLCNRVIQNELLFRTQVNREFKDYFVQN